MNLRSRRTGPSGKGDNLPLTYSSDEDDVIVVASDSDYNVISDDGEDSLDMIEENEGGSNLNSDPQADFVVADVEPIIPVYNAPVPVNNVSRKNKRVPGKYQGDEGMLVLGAEEAEMAPELGIDLGRVRQTKTGRKNERKRKRKRGASETLMWEVWEEELERWVEANMEIDADVESLNEVVAETVDSPSDLIMPLLRYQKEWLAWALKQEESSAKGGILADEMGMGKTVQAIALVLARREFDLATLNSNRVAPSTSSTNALPEIKGTLVICPVVAVMQWVNEIDRFTLNGSNKVLVYHGAKRGKDLHQFSDYDFIITTYSIVENEYRKNMMPPKQKCKWCGKSFYENKLPTHLRYYCGPGAVKTAKQSKQQSKGQKLGLGMSKQKTAAKGNASRKGVRKKYQKHFNEEEDLGIGSSIENSSEHGVPTKKSILHSVKWDRIILDEGHYIKGRRCTTTKAVLALESSYKWALSGTPLQNRVGELYSLVRFLQITPYSYYFCKDCDCRALDYRYCLYHTDIIGDVICYVNPQKFVATPIQVYGNRDEGKKAMILLKHKILKSVLLRRTKKGRAADLALPPRIVSLRRDFLDIKEEDYYISLYNESCAQFNTYVEKGTVMNNYGHIFDLLTRLRQAVDHPYLVVYSNTAMAKSGNIVDAGNGEQVCGICHDPIEDPVVTSCAHVFCKSCLKNFCESIGKVSCPTCSKPLTVDFTTSIVHEDQNTKTTVKGFKRSSILNRIKLDDFQTSTKIDALREEIRFMVERDGSAKGLVFSQFTSFLDLIHYSLQKSGVNCVQLDGSMTMGARDAAIKKFIEDPDCKIFLMSLKAGGVALNLTVASHVFLMDPWWNPAVERQAQDRIHRIGQYKPIRIVRFIIQDTIEERILKLQEKKELVFEGTVGGSSEALTKLTEADLKFLFVT
ncbi:hypothetical protein RJ640_015904 [Escallonia rubra]|uniref:DNA repair protein RAD16 n=1 Tax=Escallonia rubra TaxID=112253 RepID=A0AA88R0T4_9ASTE|nr:hypothetical protein RJ640_015904 [Escallonia rubra]